MKIDNLAPVMRTTIASETATKQMNFTAWLEPEKPLSGDEYYWQHQSHLQQSDLHFSARDERPQPQKKEPIDADKNTFKETTLGTKKDKQDMDYAAPETTSTTAISYLKATQRTSALAEYTPNPERSGLCPGFYTGLNSIESTADVHPNTAPKRTLNPMPDYKNCHLFISEKHAELTLNLHHLDKTTQKELIYIINEHLKKKGLLLNRLIINGVHHD